MIENFTKEELMNEKWRDIAGYDGMYQVSDLGRVRSLKFGRVKVLKGGKDRYGYLQVHLWKNNKGKTFLVHRLVAQAFIPNDDETKNQINHQNEVKSDSRAVNLEWCDRSYNVTYNDLNWRKKGTKRRKIEKLYDPNLSINENLEVFRTNGIECSNCTVVRLRKDIGLTKQYSPRKKTN